MEENAFITGNVCPEYAMMKLVSAKEGKWENLVLIILSVIKLQPVEILSCGHSEHSASQWLMLDLSANLIMIANLEISAGHQIWIHTLFALKSIQLRMEFNLNGIKSCTLKLQLNQFSSTVNIVNQEQPSKTLLKTLLATLLVASPLIKSKLFQQMLQQKVQKVKMHQQLYNAVQKYQMFANISKMKKFNLH